MLQTHFLHATLSTTAPPYKNLVEPILMQALTFSLIYFTYSFTWIISFLHLIIIMVHVAHHNLFIREDTIYFLTADLMFLILLDFFYKISFYMSLIHLICRLVQGHLEQMCYILMSPAVICKGINVSVVCRIVQWSGAFVFFNV